MDKKSPSAALLWSFTMGGFGQLYNKDYVIGFTLLTFEIIINYCSNLNLSLLYTMHGDFLASYHVVNFKWALFYPSIWGFSMWQAYNRARVINQESAAKKADLTGLLFGLVFGMNLGVMLQITPLSRSLIFMSPVINGLLMGLVGAILGHQIEKIIWKKGLRK